MGFKDQTGPAVSSRPASPVGTTGSLLGDGPRAANGGRLVPSSTGSHVPREVAYQAAQTPAQGPTVPQSNVKYTDVTEAQVRSIATSLSKEKVADDVTQHVDQLNQAMKTYEITTRLRQAMFLAECAAETGGFRKLYEVWAPKQVPQQLKYGEEWRGRGLIHLTWKDTYQKASNSLKTGRKVTVKHKRKVKNGKFEEYETDTYYGFVDKPDLAADPKYMFDIAGWFWRDYKKINDNIGDTPKSDISDFRAVTVKVNGGLFGWGDRKWYYREALKTLDVAGKDAAIKTLDADPDVKKYDDLLKAREEAKQKAAQKAAQQKAAAAKQNGAKALHPGVPVPVKK